MGCFVSMACCFGWEDKSFGGDKEGVLDEEDDELDEEDVDELDEEDVEEDVSDSESEDSEGVVAFRLKDGNTIGSRTDRSRISDEALWDLLRFSWRVILDAAIWE